MLLSLLLHALFSLSFIFGKLALAYSGPIFITATRMIIAGLLLLVYQYIQKQPIVMSRKYIWPLISLTIFNVYLTNVLEFWGLQYLTAAKACFLYNLSPFVAALLSYFMFKEKMTMLQCIALVIGFLGFVPILLNDSAPEASVGGISFISWPEFALLGAAVATVYGWIAMKQLVKMHYSAVTANGISMLAGGLLSLITSFFFEAWCPWPVTCWNQFWIWIILLTLVSNIICYNLYGYLLKKHSATFMTFVGFSSPFFTAFFGWLWLNETVTWHFYISAVIVFAALYLYYYEELNEPDVL